MVSSPWLKFSRYVYWSWHLSESSLVQSITVLWVRKSGVVMYACIFHLK